MTWIFPLFEIILNLYSSVLIENSFFFRTEAVWASKNKIHNQHDNYNQDDDHNQYDDHNQHVDHNNHVDHNQHDHHNQHIDHN